jgi:signal transduction histidine kinase/CheY-like chemotaxis protein
MVFISCLFLATLVEEQVIESSESVLDTAEQVIYASLREAEVALLASSISLENRLNNHQTNEQIRDCIIEFADNFKQPDRGITGFTDCYGYINGIFMAGDQWHLDADYAPESRPWYLSALNGMDRIVWTIPYIDEDTKKIVVSVSKTLKRPDGSIYGVVAIDIDVASVADYVIGLKGKVGGYGMLVNQDFVYIGHPDSEYLGRYMREFSSKHAEIEDGFRQGKTKFSAIKLENNKKQMMMSFFRKLQNDWYVGLAVPVAAYKRNIYLMIFFIASLGFIFMLILSYIMLQLSETTTRANEENSTKSSFLAQMSHEIRTPMNAIVSLTEIVLRKNLSKDVREQILIIKESGATLLTLINNILDFSKMEAGKLHLEAKEYSFAALVKDVVNVIRMRLQGKPLDFIVRVDSGIPAKFEGDEVRIRQVLINILNNAVKYTQFGHISLDVQMETVDENNVRLFFKVSDTGIGIKIRDMKLLFTEFSRVDTERNLGIEGTGLGLAIANTICKAMDGEISVSSVYDQGSIFTVSFVQKISDAKKVAAVPEPQAKKVILYEENSLRLASLKDGLVNLGISPLCCATLSEFLQRLEHESCDSFFVPSKYASDSIPVWGKNMGTGQLVIMTELDENNVFEDTKSIGLPVYSISLASSIKDTGKNKQTDADIDEPEFTAQDAYALVVDDISTNLMIAEELLKFYELRIDTSRSGENALALVQKNRYDLIFMDHMMPGMDGVETTAKIRQMEEIDPYYRNVPIIALTANALTSHREMFLRNGFNDFLAKPIEMEKLFAILSKWISKEKQHAVGEAAHRDIPETSNLTMPGVDVKAGIRNTGGTLVAYLKVLSIFQHDAMERLEAIKQTAATGDIDLYTTMVHSLKSASRSIGAQEFGDFAEEMEVAGRNKDLSIIRRRTEELLKRLHSLIDDISVFQAQNNTEVQSSVELSKDQLETLKTAFEEMNIEAIDSLISQYEKLPLNKQTKKFLESMEKDTLLFEYEKAEEEIKKVIENQKLNSEIG